MELLDGGDDLAPNQVSGSQTAECYVRTHFKLLRADFVGPLRDGVRAARADFDDDESWKPQTPSSKKFT